jgi:hypothetical protein
VLLGWLSLQQGFENYIGKPMRNTCWRQRREVQPDPRTALQMHFDVNAAFDGVVDLTPDGYPVVEDQPSG